MSVSLLIPTTKTDIAADVTHADEWLTEGAPGISCARNLLASRARGSILVFMDDDVNPDSTAWNRLINVRHNEVIMCEGYSHPITRVMALHKYVFNDIGGFDERIRYNGEDLDFYWRALSKGYNVSILPRCRVKHRAHGKPHFARYHFEGAYTRVKHRRVSLDYFVQTNPIISLLRLAGVLYYKWT